MTDFKANMYQIRFRLSHHQKLANDQVISKITKNTNTSTSECHSEAVNK